VDDKDAGAGGGMLRSRIAKGCGDPSDTISILLQNSTRCINYICSSGLRSSHTANDLLCSIMFMK
jgi:hypothetical protein